jgi:hypothetical protein
METKHERGPGVNEGRKIDERRQGDEGELVFTDAKAARGPTSPKQTPNRMMLTKSFQR